MHTPTLFPPTELDPQIICASPEPTPRDTRDLDATHDDTVVFSRLGMQPVTLREVAPPTGEFFEYLFAEWCDEEITDWATIHLEHVAQVRADVYARLIADLDTSDYCQLHSTEALHTGVLLRDLIARTIDDETRSAACAAIWAAVATRART
ncbi:hypothetical protein [Dietzia sp. 179-F 9C3 NHS]|uniref:hypothetical protein n=1 Tax=Dietzia sp. 179-F 9C3 NHS TaxID=3374295 RepID=UPI0038792928